MPKTQNNGFNNTFNGSLDQLPSPKKIILKNQPSIHYDLLSINTGSISKKNNLKIEKNAKCIFIKPINNLIQNLKIIDQLTNKNNLIKLSIIGGGVAAFELGFALHQRYQSKVSLTIFSRHILSEKNLNTKSILKLKQISKKMNITLIEENVLEIKTLNSLLLKSLR